MKKRFGDRKDGKLIRHQDSMHFIMPLIYPGRTSNEAYISQRIDMTNMLEWIAKKNAANPEYKYTFYQAIVTAALRLITIRPKLNTFIQNGNTYERNERSASFTIKKIFADDGGEFPTVLRMRGGETFEDIHQILYKQVSTVRSETGGDSTEDIMELMNKLPRFISKGIVHFVCWLDKHGWVPSAITHSDPYYASVILSNIGSIKLQCGYHHLTNWGTTSLFVIIGEKKKRPIYNEDGTYEMKETIDLGLTIDERLADGYYYSKSVKILKKLLENPELLDEPLEKEVEI